MRKKITLTESELVGLINKIISEQKVGFSNKLQLPNESRKLKSNLGEKGEFYKDRKVVVFKSGGKEMSFPVPTLRLSGPGQWEIDGTFIIFSERN